MYISYQLPKSIFTHTVKGKRNPTDAFNVLENWLNKYTVYEEILDTKLNFCIPVEFINSDDFKFLENEFGTHKVYGKVQDYKTEIISHEMWEYKFPYNKIKEVLSFITGNDEKLKKFNYQVTFSVSFLLKNKDGAVLSNQNLKEKCHSSFFCFLEKNSSISPKIYFPFEKQDLMFADFYNFFSTNAPFKMNDKYLKLENK